MGSFFEYISSLFLGIFRRKPRVLGILNGSENIDRMRKEIKEILPLLVGLLLEFFEARPDLSPPKKNGLTHFNINAENGFNWKFNISSSQKSVELYCGNDPIFFYEFTRQPTLPLHNVQIVYEQLEPLIGGFRKKFPFMDIQLSPFLNASSYRFS